jgi:hypothetical protein
MAYLRCGKYWQKSIRRGDRVESRYLGKDELAAFLAEMDAEERGRREADRLERLEAEGLALATLAAEAIRGAGIRRATEAILGALGYARHERGRFRRRRSMKRGDVQVIAATAVPCDPAAPPGPGEIQALFERARAGEDGAMAEFGALARSHPKLVAAATATSLLRAARLILADQVAKNPATHAAFVARVDALEAELIPDGAGIATKLLAAVVAQAHNEWWALCACGARRLATAGPGELRREHAALRRYLSSLRAYAQIQRLEEGGRS